MNKELSSLIDDFLLEKTSKETRRAYAKSLESFMEFSNVESIKALAALIRTNVVAFRNHLREEKGFSPAYIARALAAISSLFKWLQTQDVIQSNPCELVKRYKVSQESRTEGLSEEEVKRIFDACQDASLRGLRDRAVLVTLYYQGLRRGSLSKLELRDLRNHRKVMVLRNTKTSDYNEIPLRREVAKAIDDYLTVLGTELGIYPGEREPVFVSLSKRSKGKRLSPNAIWQIVKKRAKEAGISRRIVPHSFRHACATHALDRGAQIEEVAELLTHQQLATTQRYDDKRRRRSKAASKALRDLTA